jgi:predicted mannosyl-3-phosphoglycerate phosphatase (HAD superfamily)
MGSTTPLVVFSNIDELPGRPAESAWHDAARELRLLEEAQVPLVLCSSRTRTEVQAVQQRFGIRHPFVCERGAAAFVPAGYFDFRIAGARDVAGYHAIEFGTPAGQVIDALRRVALRQGLDVIGFSDMSVEEVAQDCQLSLLDARLAKLREYGERFRLIDPGTAARQRLFRALEQGHLQRWRGDRYHDVATVFDPMRTVDLLYAFFRRSLGAVVSVGATEAMAPFLTSEPALQPDAAARPATLVDWAQRTSILVRRLREQPLSVPS